MQAEIIRVTELRSRLMLALASEQQDSTQQPIPPIGDGVLPQQAAAGDCKVELKEDRFSGHLEGYTSIRTGEGLLPRAIWNSEADQVAVLLSGSFPSWRYLQCQLRALLDQYTRP